MSLVQIAFPARVIRGSGALEEIGTLCAGYGSRAMLIGGVRGLAVTEARIGNCLRAAAVELVGCEQYGGECSETQIARLAAVAHSAAAQVLIVAGGARPSTPARRWERPADCRSSPCRPLPPLALPLRR